MYGGNGVPPPFCLGATLVEVVCVRRWHRGAVRVTLITDGGPMFKSSLHYWNVTDHTLDRHNFARAASGILADRFRQ
jgi:hypothetical protein